MARVSVVIPTYNRAKHVCEAVESVLSQSYRDFEILVVDDGSEDNTRQRLASFGDRIRYLWQPNSGPAVARNRGILEAQAKYVAFLDSDDLWYADKLAKQVAILDENPEIGMVYCDCSRGAEIRYPAPKEGAFGQLAIQGKELFRTLMECNPVWTPAVMCRRSVLASSGLMDPTLRQSEDYDLWVRLAYATQTHFIPEVLVHVREHQGRTTRDPANLPSTCRAAEIQACRWAFLDKSIVNGFRQLAASRYISLAHTLRVAHRYTEASDALRKSMRYAKSPLKILPKLVALRCCPWLFTLRDRYIRKTG